ncbi:MAG: efflux RND transporter periplasmic adaptor subunit [Chloroflexi bacterium]|nr:efflux RND transporter periplasmic adaptor subunit [Chloroflexota bacterium]
MHERLAHIRRFAPLVVIGVLLVAAVVYLVNLTRPGEAALEASGTIEAVSVRLAAELGGRVLEVLVREGEAVTAGQALVRLDDALLQAQRRQAAAALAQAPAGVTAAQLELEAAQQAHAALFENLDLARAQAAQEAARAATVVRDLERNVVNLASPSKQTEIDKARANVVLLADRLDKAREAYEPYANKPEDNLTRASLQQQLAAAQQSYDDAVRLLNNLEGTTNPLDLGEAEAELLVARERLAQAQRNLDDLAEGPDPDALALAETRLENAQAQLTAAQARVTAAEAALAALDLQIEKMTVRAPRDGIVLSRSVEPGEVVLPGAPLITLADLSSLTITVFLPEDLYGRVSLGAEAGVRVDSFPGEVFSGEVVRIADQAEFTPRNVQTVEGRKTTVFAIELRVDDPQGRLKPGMPADVDFED